MIRSLLLVSLFAPAAALASTAPCGTPPLAPLPASVPAPEMARPATAILRCVDLAAFTARLRQPVAPMAPRAATPAAQGAYVPKTAHDNTPWRFDMTQNGRRMTAEEFDAWMKAKGIRVATGKPGASTPTAAAPAAAAPAPAAQGCVPSATVTC
ncbi:hypothetical protein [Arenimonas sp. MALMAid1274]|uniref:hypothetical protein n=1 Tax=Arenimonas sp. MALMAid1274 TaxID=3411630 RepID=UPI003BA00A81